VNANLENNDLGELFEEVANYFSLLCEPTRLKILYAVCNGERSVGDIVIAVGSTQTNVSRQINMLYRAGVLGRRKEGAQVFYRVDDQKTIDLCKSVCGRIAVQMGRASPVA
jgi:DNA-binding transcriptional ArsR family regulator